MGPPQVIWTHYSHIFVMVELPALRPRTFLVSVSGQPPLIQRQYHAHVIKTDYLREMAARIVIGAAVRYIQ